MSPLVIHLILKGSSLAGAYYRDLEHLVRQAGIAFVSLPVSRSGELPSTDVLRYRVEHTQELHSLLGPKGVLPLERK
jgi:hypothetical protein